MKPLLTFVGLLFVSPLVHACMCPPNMASWLRQADEVLVVHVQSVATGREDMLSGKACNTNHPTCLGVQVANIATAYTVKASGHPPSHITSGYGGGDWEKVSGTFPGDIFRAIGFVTGLVRLLHQ